MAEGTAPASELSHPIVGAVVMYGALRLRPARRRRHFGRRRRWEEGGCLWLLPPFCRWRLSAEGAGGGCRSQPHTPRHPLASPTGDLATVCFDSLDLKMAAQSAPKVVLKSTTKMSLNERFTNMLKNKQPMPVNIRASMQQQQQLASARNRRLAQQMENRPSVQAALKLKQKSLKQRLGKSNIQARLGRPAGPLARGAMGGRGLSMGQRGLPRGAMRGGRGARALLRGGVSLRGQGLLRGGRGISPRMGLRRGGLRGRGGPGRGGLGRGAMGRGGLGGRGRGMTGRGRGGFGGRGRGRGRGRGSARPALTKEQLDNQLDAYMSKTKGHLDAELDAYMAQTDPETND